MRDLDAGPDARSIGKYPSGEYLCYWMPSVGCCSLNTNSDSTGQSFSHPTGRRHMLKLTTVLFAGTITFGLLPAVVDARQSPRPVTCQTITDRQVEALFDRWNKS